MPTAGSDQAAAKAVLSRRELFRKYWPAVPGLMAGGGGGAYGYGTLLERHQVVVEKYKLEVDLGSNGPRHLRVVGLTDFHFDPLFEIDYLKSCVEKANALDADVVFMTGDFITGSSRRVEELGEVLGGLKSKSGAFACLGNHDFGISLTG